MAIERAAVIGAGLMGSGIAAQIANAGVPVLLLDIVPKDGADRSAIAKGAIDKLLKADPAPLMSKSAAKLITPGNIEDDLDKLKDVDWIVEAVIEKLDVKQSLYRKLEPFRKKDSVVSSNTSTIPLQTLIKDEPESLQRDFVITHFFNPPRYMRLLEVLGGAKTRPEALAAVSDFGDRRLGKAIIAAKDTPGFVANRIGVFWMQAAVNAALDLGLTVEEADAIMGRPIGAPKTGIFGLLDLVGLDLQPHVDKSMREALKPDDAYQTVRRDFPLMETMIKEGYTGRKGKGGFYRLQRNGAEKVKESIDLKTGDYHVSDRARLESADAAKGGLKVLVTHKDKGGHYAWAVLSKLLRYAASLVPEISGDIANVDLAMRTGFNWKRGPFEMIDQLGAAWFAEKLAAEKLAVPPLLKLAAEKGGFYKTENGQLQYLGTDGAYHPLKRAEGVLLLADIKRASKPILKNGSASLWDIGDGVACLEFHSKMNAIDPDTLDLVKKSVAHVGKSMKALVVHNEGDNFSVGANIGLALFAANIAMWPMIEDLIGQGQATYKAVKFAPFPVIGAPSGMALGGGCEILLHCASVQAHAETYMGLVEVGVGLIPGWGGCKELLLRNQPGPKDPKGPMPPVAAAFETISLAKVAKSAAEAKELKLLRASDGITMNRDRLLFDAKARALQMLAEGYKPPEPKELRLPGPTGVTALHLAVDGFRLQGRALPHDVTVSAALADVLSGGATDFTTVVTEDQVQKLEKKAFMALLRTGPTLARMEHMLTTGKPLRN
ncbi:3-hydroxyacyl-CoA dehydrogenase/enoyl-CoA hydratase family protein [Dongia sedimenti]|uniref:3-hydroxyacyl-CoA dehydrogenase NAD-binding domain-containing protein n=1 Tax=Dongia sedimenti TaxID=3064282 RepID=A0ABU0YNI8_9PROT|nr:3-hydroxyacyl-CoA dehydrogenase NAD-binding domain-containing protein [Rhodospirillaceae bacterium R-7]